MAYYFCGYAYERTTLGKLGEGTQARCLPLFAYARALRPGYGIFIYTAGFTKENPTNPSGEVKRSFATDMAVFTRKSLQRACQVLIPDCSRLAWGTLGETREMVALVAYHAKERPGESVDVFISTHKDHLRRVSLCWWFMAPAHWNLHFVQAQHEFPPFMVYREIVASVVYLYRLIRLQHSL